MKLNLFTLFIFCIFLSKAQSWCKPGALWHNGYGGGVGSGYARVEYIKDSLVNGINYNLLSLKVEGVKGDYLNPTHFLYKNIIWTHKTNQIVYLENDTLYPVQFVPGMKWRLPMAGNYRCQSVVTALDTGHVTMNGFSFKYIDVFVDKPHQSYHDRIIEGVGFLNAYIYMNDFWCWNDCFIESGGALRCYSDNIASFTNQYNGACDAFYTSTGIKENNNTFDFYIAPNPSAGTFKINSLSNHSVYHLSICNALGKVIVASQEIRIENRNFEIDLSEFPSGIYFVSVVNAEGKMARQKLVLSK